MDESIPSIIGGTTSGEGDKTLPRSASNLLESALADLSVSAEGVGTIVAAMNGEVDELLAQVDEGMEGSFLDMHNTAVSDLAKSAKGRDVILDQLYSDAMDEAERAREAVRMIGGMPMVMTDEAYAMLQAGSEFAEAMDRIIMPAIEQQRVEIQQIAEGDTSVMPPPPPDSDNDGVPDTQYPIGEPIPVPGLPDEEQPGPVDPGPVPEPGPEPEPPTSGYPPEDDSKCCPPQQIIVPAPIVNIRLPDGMLMPFPIPEEPTSEGPQPEPEPTPTPTPSPPGPTSPPPPPPETTPKPPPPPPIPRLPDMPGVAQVGAYDGPAFCEVIVKGMESVARFGKDGAEGPLVATAMSVTPLLAGIPLVGKALSQIWSHAVNLIDRVHETALFGSAAVGINDPGAAVSHMALETIPSVVQKYTGVNFDYYLEPARQAARSMNPVYMIGQPSIDRAYQAGLIDLETWECFTKAQGNMPWQHFLNVQADRRRPGMGELVTLRLRGQITDQQFYDRARGEGVLSQDEAQDYLKLAIQLPTLTDLMRWMVKDVGNPDYVELAGLDEDFTKAWPKEFDELAKAQGITDQQIKYEYRASWGDIPLTQIYQMFFRLRPGKVRPDLAFSRQNALDLMKIQEVPPKFRERLLEVAYNPINRTDLIQSYQAGTMDQAELVERFQDLGYSPSDAEALTRLIVAKAENTIQGSMGAWTRRTIVKEYVEGTIDEETARTLLSRTVIDPNRIDKAIEDANAIRKAQARKLCIKGVRRRYFTGEITVDQAKGILMQIGVPITTIDDTVTGWECERNSRSKEPTVAQLAKMFKFGIITIEEFTRRCFNLGFTEADAQRIAVSQGIEVTRQRQREDDTKADRDARRAERLAKKNKKDQG